MNLHLADLRTLVVMHAMSARNMALPDILRLLPGRGDFLECSILHDLCVCSIYCPCWTRGLFMAIRVLWRRIHLVFKLKRVSFTVGATSQEGHAVLQVNAKTCHFVSEAEETLPFFGWHCLETMPSMALCSPCQVAEILLLILLRVHAAAVQVALQMERALLVTCMFRLEVGGLMVTRADGEDHSLPDTRSLRPEALATLRMPEPKNARDGALKRLPIACCLSPGDPGAQLKQAQYAG
mmetsp:Transcript_14968/g.32908  ORF Transcript_14968/g.32908 Transcript_14968/m.32908 type:complete len:238 (-) Transcript_14968:170-883(-)